MQAEWQNVVVEIGFVGFGIAADESAHVDIMGAQQFGWGFEAVGRVVIARNDDYLQPVYGLGGVEQEVVKQTFGRSRRIG